MDLGAGPDVDDQSTGIGAVLDITGGRRSEQRAECGIGAVWEANLPENESGEA